MRDGSWRQKGVMPIRKWTIAYLIFLLVMAMAAGCLGTRAPVTDSPAPPAIILDYHRTGGIAGFDDRLVIFDNGAAVISTRSLNREFQVNQSELARMNQVFGEAAFDTLQGNYTARRGGADFMRYSITYRGKTVITEDTAIPDPLKPVIRELNTILGTGRSPDLMSGSFAGIKT
jgi:hypothetical protein